MWVFLITDRFLYKDRKPFVSGWFFLFFNIKKQAKRHYFFNFWGLRKRGRLRSAENGVPLHRVTDRAAGVPQPHLKKDFMEQLNKVELRGVVGSIRTQTFDESRMARISLATNYAYKDREGTAVIDTSWHNVVAWEGRSIPSLVRIVKGSKLAVTGRIRYQKYTGLDGVDRVATDILASRLQLIDDPEPMQYEM